MQMMVTAVTHTMASNHLSTQLYQLPEYLNRNRSISNLLIEGNLGGGVQNNNSDDGYKIYNYNGQIYTRYISDWRSLSKMDQENMQLNNLGLAYRSDKAVQAAAAAAAALI